MFGRHSDSSDGGWYRQACGAAREAARHARHRHHGGFPFGPGGFEAPFGRFPFGRFPFGGGARARRGDVRGAILALLAEQPRNGYQIMQELEKRSRSVWRPSPGSVYPALQQLQDEGLIEEKAEGTGRTFSLTEAGRAYVREHPDEVRAPWEDDDEEDDAPGRELFGALRDTAVALWQIAVTGTAAQRAEARKVLEETRRALYRILASEGSRRDG
ncbi:MAG TPA: PadR family transcriptional regulator [Vicinamibacteria bacterium]|nr:PadR family transcriptional regulator [Vicinamibacteria bacterium]